VDNPKKAVLLIVITTVVALTVGGAAMGILYRAAVERIFGYRGSEILGQPLTRIIPDRYCDAHRTGLDRVNTGGDFRDKRGIVLVVEDT